MKQELMNRQVLEEIQVERNLTQIINRDQQAILKNPIKKSKIKPIKKQSVNYLRDLGIDVIITSFSQVKGSNKTLYSGLKTSSGVRK